MKRRLKAEQPKQVSGTPPKCHKCALRMIIKIQVKNGEFTRVSIRGKHITSCSVQVRELDQSATKLTEICLENNEVLKEVQIQSGSALSPFENAVSSVNTSKGYLEVLVIGGRLPERSTVSLSTVNKSTPEAA